MNGLKLSYFPYLLGTKARNSDSEAEKRGKGTEAANTESCSDCVSEPEEANLHCPSCG